MSSFRFSQGNLRGQKQNTISLGIIFGLIFILCIQIWLLYSAVNNAFDEHTSIVIPAFIASLVLFIIGLGSLQYLKDEKQ